LSDRRLPLDQERIAESREAQEVEAEVTAHLAHRVDDLIAEGLPPDAARKQAAAEFGDADRIMAESRAVKASNRSRTIHASRASGWDRTAQDVGFALRQLRYRPGFAFAALLTLAIGIGATVTIASVVRSVVLAPLPFEDPSRVVFPEMLTPDGQPFSVAEAVFPDWRTQTAAFEEMAALRNAGGILRRPGRPRSVRAGRVTHTLLDVVGLEPELGRFFSEAEDLPGAPASVALYSYETWRTDLGADPDVVGTTLDLDGRSYEVIGVMPEDISLATFGAQLFVPLGPDPTVNPGDHDLLVMARLTRGVTMEQADLELKSLQARLSEQYSTDLGWTTQLRTAREELIGDTVETAGWVLLAAAGVLLLMACVNVSNLLMVRATTRRTEMAVRAALGASGGRLARQLFTESMILAVAGGLLGLLAALTVLPVVKAIGAARIPRLDAARLDGQALVVGLASVAVVAALCGLAPVVQMRAGQLARSLVGSRGSGGDPGRRLRSVFVTAQVAMTVVLLAGTGLMFRSFVELLRVDPGFEVEGTLAFKIDMPDAAYSREEREGLIPMLREAVQSVPGVVEVGATAVDPFSGNALANFVASEERTPDRAADFTPVHWRVVTPGFFEAMGMELIGGRAFEDRDGWDDGIPVVIGASLAQAMWEERDPIGRRLVWGDPEGSRMTVVGVVEDLRDVSLTEEALPIIYRSHRSIPWAVMTMVARVEGNPTSVIPGIRARLAEVAPNLPVGEARSLKENLGWAVAEPRFNLQMLSSFAVLGLLMAIIGVYGLTAFDVRRRMPEIGIRLSLGAEPRQIQRLIITQGMSTTLVGVAVGLVIAWGLSGAIRSLLFGVTPGDPMTWVGVASLVILSALAATVLPARKVSRVDAREVLNAND